MIYNHINASNFCFVWLVCSLTSSPINTRDFCLVWSAYSLTWSSNNTSVCCLVWLICSQSTDLQPYKYQYKWLAGWSVTDLQKKLSCRLKHWPPFSQVLSLQNCGRLSQFWPVHPSTQLHMYWPGVKLSVQVPLCWHGSDWHSSMSVWKTKQNMNSCEQVLWKKIWDK